jgi:hypothetical protein
MHIETAPVAIIATDNCAVRGIAFARRRAILADMVEEIQGQREKRRAFYELAPAERDRKVGDFNSRAAHSSTSLRHQHLARGYLRGTPYRTMEAKCHEPASAWSIANNALHASRPDDATLEAVRAWLAA